MGDADRAGEIIDRIRDHIRKAPPRKARFDLNSATNEVIALARSAIARAEILVQTRLAEGLFPVNRDHQHPASGGGAQEAGTLLSVGC